ncbi:hypothetical protein LX99_00067 [Mucilaginibacter oryzae]|uniref:HD/PDEase domain-containing protein n=1 Tax=Mucilaginibacter oryzae TaxID=468058 RepID=A0A316HHZ8_9SPHI|nr:HD domain-containing protein [Mucilaginibacter oryzae]PWK79610.1 hypothetical protein LX99_00067 [Mucilaginibacter oryzae]
MKLADNLYGQFEIELVLADLLYSTPVQRLRNVHQGGAIFLVNPAINHTRYQHSVGVMYLVKWLGGSMEEQIAALLHDASHTAFSHVADYIFENLNEDYHESIFEDVIVQSEVPAILKRHGYSIDILFNQQHKILEQPLPALCADRVDYTLRDLYHAGLITLAEVKCFLTQLVLQDDKIALLSGGSALWISNKFLQLNNNYFKKPEHVYANIKMAGLLKYALQNGVINTGDLLKDDFDVLALLMKDTECNISLEDIKSMSRFKHFAAEHATALFKKRELHPAVLYSASA